MGEVMVLWSGAGEVTGGMTLAHHASNESLQRNRNCCGDRFIVRCRQPFRSQSLGCGHTLQHEQLGNHSLLKLLMQHRIHQFW